MTEWWSGDNIGNLRKGAVMKVRKIGIVIIGLVPFNVYGECTPTPDCASIGYSETSCEGDYLACPFDSTKLKCIPCDSSFRYDCSGENITGGTGSACGGKYVSCECSEGSVFKDGACACDATCSVGNIYYSDGTCSSCVNSNKTAVGIVVKDKELIAALSFPHMKWAPAYEDITELANITDETLIFSDYNGKANTFAIAAYYGENGDIENTAALYCYNYMPDSLPKTLGNWYLPAWGQLYETAYPNYTKIKEMATKFGVSILNNVFWSSTEYSYGSAWRFDLSSAGRYSYYKVGAYSVMCFLEI